MNQDSAHNGTTMPRALDFFLTKRVPCALLAVMMLTSAYWFNVLFGNIPLLGFLFVLVGMLLHLAVPGLFALVMFGGGLKYSLQVGGIAALSVLLLSSGSFYAMLIFMALFVALPVMTAVVIQRQGLGKAAWLLALGLFLAVVLALTISSNAESIEAFVNQLFKPIFDNMVASLPPGETEAVLQIHQLQAMMVEIFPGILAFGLWVFWWGFILYARKTAVKYSFYQGDNSEILTLLLPKQLVYVLLVFIGLANIAAGDVQYVALNGVLVIAGLVSVQGVMVVHTWLKSREMLNTIIVMYVMLFFWSFIVVVFVLIGLLDIWFNFRRNLVSTTGEK
jgi:hypothetical protein